MRPSYESLSVLTRGQVIDFYFRHCEYCCSLICKLHMLCNILLVTMHSATIYLLNELDHSGESSALAESVLAWEYAVPVSVVP